MDKHKVAERWSDRAVAFDAFSPQLYWLAIPAVQARHQRRACGGRNYASWVDYCLAEFMPSLPAERMLSIGCGHGALERQLFALRAFEACDAFDIAPGAIEAARKAAAEAGMASIRYEARDIETIDIGEGRYDAVWFNGSLHHIEALERVLDKVRRALKPNGLLFFHEYVGADHFAFSPAQRAAIEHAFFLIPETYRKSFAAHDFGETAMRAPLPDPIEVARADPSEAVRSSAILPAVSAAFDVLALNAAGGSLLQFLLSGIAGNFHANDAKSMALLSMLFSIEDALIDSGALGSDFVVCAARPKRAHLSAGSTDAEAALDRIGGEIDQLRARNAAAFADILRLRERVGGRP